MHSSALFPLCAWRDLAVSCAVLRSLWRRCPCGLTVIVIVLLTRFCTCSAMGPLCHVYGVGEGSKHCVDMEAVDTSPVRCKDNQVCCKYYEPDYTSSNCRDPTQCEPEYPGPTYCKPDHKQLECCRRCQDDECGMSFQFPGKYKLHFFFLIFTGISSLGPVTSAYEKLEHDNNHVCLARWRVGAGFRTSIMESPEEFGCRIGVVEEPADQKRIRFVLQLLVYEKYHTSKFLEDLKANWNKRLMAPKPQKHFPYGWIKKYNFTDMIDHQLPVSFVQYEFTLPCPEVEDERQGIHTKWPYTLAVGRDVRVLCSQETGFNGFYHERFAVRTCQRDGQWSDDVDVTRCPSKGKLNSTQVNKLPNPGEDGDAEEASPEDRGESSSRLREWFVPLLLIGVCVGVAIAAIVVGLAYWKLKDKNVAVEGQQPLEKPADGEDIESKAE